MKYSRDLSKPLAPTYGSDDPTFKQKKKALKQQNTLTNLATKGETQSKNISANKKKSGATKGSGAKAVGTGVSTAVSTLSAIGGAVAAFRKPNGGSSNSAR